MKKTRNPQDDRPDGLTHNPFTALRPAGKSEPRAPEPVSPPARTGSTAPRAGRLLVQREKKGRGGKTVTRVTGLAAGADALAELARELKRALGCGASVEGADILLQGAQTERAARWLRQRFQTDVTIGN